MPRQQGTPVAQVAALILIALGAVIMVLAVFADSLGIIGGGRGFGWKQLIAAIAGLVLLLVGVAWLIRPLAEIPPEESDD